MNRLVNIVDDCLCYIYDKLWGAGIYRILSRCASEKRHLNWHEMVAFQLADFLPPRIVILPWFLQKKILSYRLKRKIFG